ncbi:MAG: DUF3570 domain-containing protein, partial [Candidatus Eisenbacteria bacterium]
MQLTSPRAPGPVRSRLRAAACLLLASSLPAVAHAEAGASTQIDTSLLLYGEMNRADVIEPAVRVTRLFANGHALSAQLGYDVITGASPTGAAPSGQVQTTTTASGGASTVAAGNVPVTSFRDRRTALDMDWRAPLGTVLTSTVAGHFSSEKDYRSVGGSAKLALDAFHRLVTITAGAGINHDEVFPVGGTPLGLTDASGPTDPARQPKRVTSGLLGVSRVLSRRWLVSLNATRAAESGFLTEPYKVVSEIDTTSGQSVGQLTENRPRARTRNDLLGTSALHLGMGVLHVSYRYYWDDWSLASHTIDLKLRHDLGSTSWWQPHARYYTQTPASFYTTGLVSDAPTPAFATSDYRLGPLRTATLGATIGFRLGNSPGEWSVRAEYIRQTLKGPHESERAAGGGDEPG